MKQSHVDINLEVSISDKKRTGHNVIGYIDNGAAKYSYTWRTLRSPGLW